MRVFFLCVALLSLFPIAQASLADEPGYVCSLQFENDFFGGGTDRHFTHGTRLSFLSKPIGWITDAADKIPWFDSEKVRKAKNTLKARASISIGQSIYTPEDITDPELILDDRPYAGWLYLGFGLAAYQGLTRFDKVELNIGVIGPWSRAEQVQKEWHSLFNLTTPEGWDHQLANEVGVSLFYEQARRIDIEDLLYALDFDIIPHFGGSLGNVFTYAAAGLTVRLGRYLKGDFGPPRIRPSLPGGKLFQRVDDFNWYLFAGYEGRGVLRNIFLDGNTLSRSHSVDKKRVVGDLQAGIAIQIRRLRMTYTQIIRSKEYEGQDRADEFGACSISYQF